MSKVLIVEDDRGLAKLIGDWLSSERHTSEHVEDGSEALQRLKVYDYDLVILDWNLPGTSGLEILKDYRGRGGSAPVLMLTGKGDITDKESGLDAGADDYLTKPFHPRELSARLRALLRRPQQYMDDVLKFAGLVLDRVNYKVTRDGEDIKLLPKEFALLEFLMRNPNRVFPPDVLLNKVWHTESDATVEAVTTGSKRLRKRLGVEGQCSWIRTVHGVGYKLEEG